MIDEALDRAEQLWNATETVQIFPSLVSSRPSATSKAAR
jgi:hypothetical protein